MSEFIFAPGANFAEEVERALLTRDRKAIWRPFMAAVREYRLIDPGDRIAVCVSGGKDSMLLAKCMQLLSRHSPLHPELVFLSMDPGYAPENRALLEQNAALLGVPLERFSADIFSALESQPGSPCHLCAKIRRGSLYRRARALGCNKIALGHHFDDVVETVLMNLLYAGQMRAMSPRHLSDNVPGIELIRPLYKLREADICAWRDQNGLKFLTCACPATRTRGEADGTDSKRQEMKRLVEQINALNPRAAANIFRSVHNVSLDGLIAWKHHGEIHSFLEDFMHD